MRYPKLLLLVQLSLPGIVVGCTLPPPPPPNAEFLVSAGDQTYWVRSDNSGLRIRGSPLILARTGGRYYEIFVSEIDRSFPKALFSGERVFRRELATGDSAIIYDDTTIVRMSDAYHQQHPRAPLLRPDDDPDDDVDISAVGETDVLNVLGPYVALEHRVSIERSDDTGDDDTTRAVIDLRNGKAVAFDHMLRDTTVQEAVGEGGLVNRRWRHDGYDVISHYDSTHKANTLALRDHRGREWRLGLIGSTYVQIFWLDRPKVDSETRHALSRAFNDATSYGERIQQVSRRPRAKSGKRATSGRQT
ncbi:MAG TPA: hypothetical protein VHT23_12975 [Gemmatimonadaceae bacterium]|jgi:hypothetical protein|nr:hypothetical protein [Gemmatimonadaceae bacterium]